MERIDHPIFLESIQFIQAQLGPTGFPPLMQQVLERLIHSSGDFKIKDFLRFSFNACELGIAALKAGAPIITDTSMAFSAVRPMAIRTLNTNVRSILEWAPEECPQDSTRSAFAMRQAWLDLSAKFTGDSSPIVVIGSAPTALISLLELVLTERRSPPSLVIGMPVGFVGVQASKDRLMNSSLPYICLDGSRGGAGLASASVNALLRASVSSS